MVVPKLPNQLTRRTAVVGALALVMLIPLGMVSNVISERNYYYNGAVADISALWGASQVFVGPVLIVPYSEIYVSKEKVQNESGELETKSKTHYVQRSAVFLPKVHRINGQLEQHYRTRGIYDSLVYASTIDVDAEFSPPEFDKLTDHLHEIQWDKARVAVGLSDTKAIDNIDSINWQGRTITISSGTSVPKLLANGFRAQLDKGHFLSEHKGALAEAYRFQMTLSIRGSQSFRFAPIGEQTIVDLSSAWPHPKFSGNVLPDTHSISEDGFSASWEIPHLARNYPQSAVYENTEMDLRELLAGVDLFEPVFIYSKITRAVKYGILFIALTFITFLAFELSTGSALHPLQYLLVGFALAVFYLLLVSLSEHLDFAVAYLLSAFACISIISAYVSTAFRNRRQGRFLFCLLSGVYLLLYALLKMEDYALLVGSWVAFIAIGIMMFLTRHLNSETVNHHHG